MRCSALGAAVLLFLAAGPVAAKTWNRLEIIGILGGNGVYGLDVFSAGIYHPRYGLGIGTRALELRGETWDLPRQGRPDASAHAIVIVAPIEARVVLASWEGSPFFDSSSAESSTGRLAVRLILPMGALHRTDRGPGRHSGDAGTRPCEGVRQGVDLGLGPELRRGQALVRQRRPLRVPDPRGRVFPVASRRPLVRDGAPILRAHPWGHDRGQPAESLPRRGLQIVPPCRTVRHHRKLRAAGARFGVDDPMYSS